MSFLNRVHWSLVGLALVSAAVLTAQSGAPQVSGDWPMYSHSLSGQRYSPLTQITPANVASLTPAWALRLTQPAAGRRGGAPPAAAGRAGGEAGAPAAPANPEAAGGGSNPEVTPIV